MLLILFVLPSLEVAAASRQEVVVGVPVDAQHCRTDWLLDVLANPPDNKKGKIINNEFITKITINFVSVLAHQLFSFSK